MILSLLLITPLLLFLEAFFSGSEMALISCDRIKIRHQAAAGSKGAQLVLQLLERPERLLATTLAGTNLCVVTNSSIAALLFVFLLGEGKEYYVSLVLTPLILLWGEMVPKAYFRQHADRLAPLLAPPIYLCSHLFSPLTALIRQTSALILHPFNLPPSGQDPYITREELKFLVKDGEHPEGLATEERRMIHKIFRLGDTAVKEAMIPLIEVVALPRGTTVAEAIVVVGEHRFSRIPIYEERIDHIVGIVHAFDLLYADSQMTLGSLARPAYYVPETKRVVDLLQQMQRERFQMAIVVDEYGGVVGIVTVEDLLEEIVGEIEDEYDEEPPPVRRLPDGSYVVDARVEVDRLQEELGLLLPEGEYETIGGFLLHLLQRIPEVGEEASYEGISFLITEADKRSILKVKIRLPERPAGSRTAS